MFSVCLCGAHLLYWSFVQVLWYPEQRQLGFLPHLMMAERAQARNRLSGETNGFIVSD